MKDIKFRVWDSIGKKMSYNPYCYPNSPSDAWDEYVDINKYFYDCKKQIEEKANCWKYDYFMQYTGLHDKNGKEVFENDIVNHKYSGIQIIFWNELIGAWSIKDSLTDDINYIMSYDDIKLIEVIGNIWETPELLEVK